jgi:hypothetical protein
LDWSAASLLAMKAPLNLGDTPLVPRLRSGAVEMHRCVDGRDTIEMNIAMLAWGGGIALRQFDALALDFIDCADMLTVRAQNFHVLLNLCNICHVPLLPRVVGELSRGCFT